MSWRNNLLDASFKGVPFKIKDHNHSSGRRTKLHQYANREESYLQDLGKQTETYTISAYIISNIDNNNDYYGERDALINALKSKGPGTLVHPFLGIKKVGLSAPYTMTETFDRGGMATFSLTFTEAGVRALPKRFLDFLTKIDDTVNRAFDLVGDYFHTGYKTLQSFMSVASTAVNRSIELNQAGVASIQNISTKVVDQVLQNMSVVKGLVSTYINTPTNIYNAMKDVPASFAIMCGMGTKIRSEAKSKKGTTKSGTTETVTEDREEDVFIDKLTIEDEVIGGETGEYSGVTRGDTTKLTGDSIPNDMGKSILKSMSDQLTDFDISPYSTTPVSQQSNIALIINTFKFTLLSFMARIGVRIDFKSQQELITYLELVANRIDEFLLELGTEAAEGAYGLGIGLTETNPTDNSILYSSMKDIKDVFIESMILKSSALAKEIDYSVGTDVISSLELAYEKYEDSERYIEIFDNNKTMTNHPGFLPNGETIIILSA